MTTGKEADCIQEGGGGKQEGQLRGRCGNPGPSQRGTRAVLRRSSEPTQTRECRRGGAGSSSAPDTLSSRCLVAGRCMYQPSQPPSAPMRGQKAILTSVKVLRADQRFPSVSDVLPTPVVHGVHFLPGNPCSSHQPQGRAPVQDLGSLPSPGPAPDQRPEVSRAAAPLALRTQALRGEENTAQKQRRQFNAQCRPLTMQSAASRPEGSGQFFTSCWQHAGRSRRLPDPQKPGAFTSSTPRRHTGVACWH